MSSRPSKYKNKKARCFKGHLHDSRGEAGYCNTLFAQEKAGEILAYNVQAIFDLPGGIRHRVDFHVLPRSTYIWEVHEFKGCATAAWRMKEKLFKEKYPHIPYRVITAERRVPWTTRPRLTGRKRILRRIRVSR